MSGLRRHYLFWQTWWAELNEASGRSQGDQATPTTADPISDLFSVASQISVYSVTASEDIFSRKSITILRDLGASKRCLGYGIWSREDFVLEPFPDILMGRRDEQSPFNTLSCVWVIWLIKKMLFKEQSDHKVVGKRYFMKCVS